MTKARLLLNSFSGTLLFLANVVFTFFLSPIIVRQLGNLNYGIWDILLSLCGYLGLLEVGIGPAIIRYVARADAFSDKKEINQILSNAFNSLAVLSLFSFLILLFVGQYPEIIFNISVKEIPFLPLLCLLAGLNLMIQFPGTVLVAYLMGLQLHSTVNFVRLILVVISGVLTYGALTTRPDAGLLWLSLILLLSNLIQYFFFFIQAKKLLGWIGFKGQIFSWQTTKELYLFGGKSFLIMLADRIQRLSIPFIIGHLIGVSFIVFFAIPARLFEYALNLINVIGFPLNAFFSAIEAKSGPEKIRKTWQNANRLLLIFIIWLVGNLGILGYDFIKIWMGIQYAEGGKWIIVLLTFSLLVNGLTSNASRLLVALDKHGGPALYLVFISIVTFGISVFLGRWWGLTGIAFSVLLGSIAGFIVCWKKACNSLGLSAMPALGEMGRPAFLPLILLCIILTSINHLNPSLSYLPLFINASLGSLFYFGTAFFWVLIPEERKDLWAKIRVQGASIKENFMNERGKSR
jgi:O-antigen/teichoic acid export membrane protein